MPTTVTIAPGDRGVDYAYLTPAAKAYILASLTTDKPVRFIARYVASTGKGLDLDERMWAHSIGLGILAIKENSIDDTDGGFANGAVVAQQAVNRLGVDPAWAGYPKGLSVTMCADKDIKVNGVDQAAAFFRGAGAVLDRAGFKLGMYGDEDCIKAVPEAAVTCLPGAWGWSPQWWRAFRAGLPWTVTPSMLQKLDKPNDVDVLTVYRPFEVWLPTPDPVPEPEVPVVRPILKRGDKGPFVVEAQTKLTKAGYRCVIDGRFGWQTWAKVRAFQRANRLPVVGRVGPRTWAALDKASA